MPLTLQKRSGKPAQVTFQTFIFIRIGNIDIITGNKFEILFPENYFREFSAQSIFEILQPVCLAAWIARVGHMGLRHAAQGKKIAQSQGLTCALEGEARDKQMAVNDDLPKLREHVQRGRYVEAVSTANRLLGMGQLTGNQVVTIERELGTVLRKAATR